jgi:Fe-S-cluster containining protein
MTVTEHFVNPPSLPLPEGEALCALCSRNDSGCCRTSPELAALSFPLSAPEWRRLAPYSALATLAVPADGALFTREENTAEAAAREIGARETLPPVAGDPPPGGDKISARELNTPEFIASLCSLFPGKKMRIGALFPPGGTHSALRIRPDGACVFLGRQGCRLPRRVRPWYCLLFPAWVVQNSLTLFSASDCLIAQNATSPAHGVSLLGDPPARLRELYACLRRDWALDAR